jgi:hypothetical protein
MAKKETQTPDGEIKTEGKAGELGSGMIAGGTADVPAVKDQDHEPQKETLMDKFFDMMISVLKMKIQRISVHNGILIDGGTKMTIDVTANKCQMFMTPFGVMLIGSGFANKKSKRLITFNNAYEITFAE